MNEYLFDFISYNSVRIRACDEISARNILLDKIQDCPVIFGKFGEPDAIYGMATTTADNIEAGEE